METITNPKPDPNADERDWLNQCARLGIDPAVEMERLLATPENDEPLPEWAK